jgi:predicted ATP-dependent endonuclease of OLD family
MGVIDNFSIKGLFGKKDIDLSFKNKVQIYIGENGLGKTTVLNTLYYLLSCDFKNLVNIIFSRIDITVYGKSFSFSKEELKLFLQAQDSGVRKAGFYQSLYRDLKDTDIKKLQSLLRSGKPEMIRIQDVQSYLNTIGYNFNAPSYYIMEMVTQVVMDRAEINQVNQFEQLINEKNTRILYFPTFRRIEKDVRTMLKERRNRNNGNYSSRALDLESSFIEELSEAVHSGMSDIKKRRDRVLRIISDISRKQLDTLSVDLLKKQISGVPEKITLAPNDIKKIDTIIHKSQMGLTPSEQDEVLQKVKSGEIYNDNNQFLLYLITRLVDIYNSYEAYDRGIKCFVEVCNSYLRDKKFTYNEADLILDLESTIKTELIQEVLDLDILSSGEKQLIALFATIYLDPQNRFIILIDEPELSLSVYWQRKLLPDVVKSPNCDFLFAVTHSPFIFDNELLEFTTGMNEFVRS